MKKLGNPGSTRIQNNSIEAVEATLLEEIKNKVDSTGRFFSKGLELGFFSSLDLFESLVKTNILVYYFYNHPYLGNVYMHSTSG